MPQAAALFALWGALQPGTHQVGFRAEILHDPIRQYGGAGQPRPVLAALWYPAASGGAAMRFGDYLRVEGQAAEDLEFAGRLSRFTRATVVEDLFQKRWENLSRDESALFARLSETAVAARRGAPAAAGRFPLVVYHHGSGGTHEENSILFEYLASHGFVVVSSAYQCPEVSTMEGCGQPPMRDLDFLLRWAVQLPNVDGARVAMVGHSSGGQAALRYAFLSDTVLRAVVSLDSTIEQKGLDHEVFRQLRASMEENERYAVPALLMAPRRGTVAPKFAGLDALLTHAPRVLATVNGLAHDEYVSDGVLADALGAGSARWRLWQSLARYVLRFLNEHVRGEAGQLEQSGDAAIRVEVKQAQPLPLTAMEVVRLYDRLGPEKAREELPKTEQLEMETVVDAGRLLLDAGRMEDAARLSRWMQRWSATHPRVYEFEGLRLMVVGKKQEARAAFDRAVRLMDAREDASAEMKETYRAWIQKVRGGLAP